MKATLSILLAVRNVRRNFRSSLLNGIGISFYSLVLLFILSLSRGIESQIVNRSIRFETGAVNISFDKKLAGFGNKAFGDDLLTRITSVLDTDEAVSHYAYRIYPSNTMLYAGDNTQRVRIIGLSETESLLIGEMFTLLEGDADLPEEEKTILISSGLATVCGLQLGDACNLMLQSVDGTVNLDEFIVKGIFRYTSQMNKSAVYMNYHQAQELYHCNLPSQIIVDLHHLADAGHVGERLETVTGELPGLEISTWEEHTGMAQTLSAINKYGMSGIAFFLLLISFVGVWSMQVEHIQARRREYGALLSFGFPDRAVKKIFLYESLTISLVFFTVGLFIGWTVISVINVQNGLYLGDSASFAFGSAIVNPILTMGDIGITLLIILAYPLFATVLSLHALTNTNIIQLLRI